MSDNRVTTRRPPLGTRWRRGLPAALAALLLSSGLAITAAPSASAATGGGCADSFGSGGEHMWACLSVEEQWPQWLFFYPDYYVDRQGVCGWIHQKLLFKKIRTSTYKTLWESDDSSQVGHHGVIYDPNDRLQVVAIHNPGQGTYIHEINCENGNYLYASSPPLFVFH